MRLRQFRIELCPLADKEHQESLRQYAHVFHRSGVICVSKAFESLPKRLQIALLLHESGHILAGSKGSEGAANRAAKDYSGVKIWYKDQMPYGDQLEWIRSEDVLRAKRALGL